MAQTVSRAKKGPAQEIDLTRFTPDLTANDLQNALTPVRFLRTNLTLVRPVPLLVQA